MLGEYYKTPALKNFTSNNFCLKYVEQFARTVDLKKGGDKIKEKEYIPIKKNIYFPLMIKLILKTSKKQNKKRTTRRENVQNLYAKQMGHGR